VRIVAALAVARAVAPQQVGRAEDLADEEARRVRELVDHRAQLAGEGERVGVVDGIEVALEEAVGVVLGGQRAQRRGVVREAGVLEQGVEDVQAQPVGAGPQPVPHHVEHRRLEPRLAPVEIRLEGQERGEVPLVGERVVVPAARADHRAPVVRRRLAPWAPARAPDVEVALVALLARTRIEEPGVLIRGVV
jgi:hypothetical protein